MARGSDQRSSPLHYQRRTRWRCFLLTVRQLSSRKARRHLGALKKFLPPDFEGEAQVKYIELTSGGKPIPVAADRSSWLLSRDRRKVIASDDGEPTFVVNLDHAVSMNPAEAWPPNNLQKLNEWLDWTAPEVRGRVEVAFATGGTSTRSVLLKATNGSFLYRATLPPKFRKEEFLTNRRVALPRLLRRAAKDIEVDRAQVVLADEEHIFGRNLGGMNRFADLNILLIGCGTIGSFLAQQLVQCGYGAGKGCLTISDSDMLRPANLGRHLLGVQYLSQNKAVATAEFLRGQLPPVAVIGRSEDFAAEHLAGGNFDLVIDATGEEAFSIALNEQAVRNRSDSPPILFSWMIGNGSAARCILTGMPDKACYKCLKPSLSGPQRFPTLKTRR